MTFEILVSKRFLKELKKYDTPIKNRLRSATEELKKDPYTARPNLDILQVKGTNPQLYRLRVGEVRILYTIQDNTIILLLRIFDREVGYKKFLKEF